MHYALPSAAQVKTKQDMAVLSPIIAVLAVPAPPMLSVLVLKVPAPPMLSVLVLKVPAQPER